jgi:hypothetical protein
MMAQHTPQVALNRQMNAVAMHASTKPCRTKLCRPASAAIGDRIVTRPYKRRASQQQRQRRRPTYQTIDARDQ